METTHCLEISKYVLKDFARDVSPSSFAQDSQDLSLCIGSEVQDPENLYFVRAWETSGQFHDLSNNFAKATQPSTIPGELAYTLHVHLSCEAYTALGAPLTEIVLWTLREGASRETVEELLPALMKIVNAIPFSEGMYKAGWGPVLNNDQQFVVMIGWENMEAFQTAVKNSPDGRALLDELDKHTERLLRHVVLSQSPPERIPEARL